MIVSILGRGSYSALGEDTVSLKDYIDTTLREKDHHHSLSIKDSSWDPNKIDITQIMNNVKYNRISLIAKYAVKASYEALNEAGLSDVKNTNETGIFLGTSEGPECIPQKFWSLLRDCGFKKANPLLFPETSINIPATYMNIAHKIYGPTITNVSGLTSGCEILEIAINYLMYGSIKNAVVVNAEEYCDFIEWRRKNEIMINQNNRDPRNLSKTDHDLIRTGANCLILQKGIIPGNKGVIKSLSIDSSDNLQQVLIKSVKNAMERAQIEKNEIDLIICHNSGVNELLDLEKNTLENIFSKTIPIITLRSVFGEQLRICTLMNIISATVFREKNEILENIVLQELGQDTEYRFDRIHKIVIVSLSSTGQCGTIILEI